MTGLASPPPAAERVAAAATEAAMWGQRPAAIGNASTCLVYVTHDAFARDLQNLIDACLDGRIWTPAAARTVRTSTAQLRIYLRAADETLCAELRAAPAALGAPDELEAKRAAIEAALAGVSDAFAKRDAASLFDQLRQLSRLLDGLMRHVEDDLLPVVARRLAGTGSDASVPRVRGLQGWWGGAARYVPWLLDGAAPPTRWLLLALLPAPIRALHELVWSPRYRRTHLTVHGRRRAAITHRSRTGQA